ncbi:MAG TPA: glycosyltransferase family 39 protein [Stellaceae bacterium]|nr:glycosyltransferase family 39 protein [Stellaceae bacterium]
MVGGFALARILWWLALLTIVGGVARIAATYPVLSATFDEPAHIAAGMQLLDRGDFTYEPLHPPLARVAAALGPWFAGYRAQNSGDLWIEGQRMFYGRDGRPDTGVVTLARFGILPFFVAAVGLVWLWTEYTFGAVEGALAAIALGNLPVMLAHAGLATTDAAFAMTFVAAFFAFLWWLERRSLPRGLALGAAVGLALCTKLLALLFLPAACGAVLVHRWFCDGRDWPVRALLLSGHRLVPPLAACLLTVWVVFGCRADPLYGVLSLADGVRQLLAFAGIGEPSYFLGEIAVHGSWAFFPVLILVKSPLPFLIAVAIGAAVLLRRDRRDWRRMAPLIGALAIIASVMPSPINIGLRHVLPALPLLAIVAAVGLGRLLEVPVAAHRAALAWVLVAWQTGEAAAAAPDYLPYFNQLALGQPQRIVTGSDLDWGQDVRRLAETLQQRRVEGLHLALHTSNDAQVYGVPPFEILYPGQPAVGWIAISEQMRAYYCAGYRWLDAYRPAAQVGASIRLYHVPGPPAEPSRPAAAQRFDWRVPQPCATASPGR